MINPFANRAEWPGHTVRINGSEEKLRQALQWLRENHPSKGDCFRLYLDREHYEDVPGKIEGFIEKELKKRDELASSITREEAKEAVKRSPVLSGLLYGTEWAD